MTEQTREVRRYAADERYAHWLTAIAFVLVAVSGLALYHPSMYWMSGLLGGGQWTRILHPFIGIFMCVVFFYLALRVWADNRMTDADRKWLGSASDIMAKRPVNVPEPGRYNGGQKVLFKLLVLCMLLLLLSGIALWRPYFAPALPIDVVRWGGLAHAVSAFILIGLVVGHVYMSIWTRGSVRGMIRGTVSRAWARHHHGAWLRQVLGQSKSG
jgi:formate dehydrogenase subunit gamma